MKASALLAIHLSGAIAAQEFRELRVMVPPTEDEVHAVVLADVDGDGALDLYAGASGTTRVYLHAGAAGFAELPGAVDAPNTLDVGLADFDGDGDLDALHGRFYGPIAHATLHRGDGTGVFLLDASAMPSFASEVKDVNVADVDLDGDLDAVLQHYPLTQAVVNDGTGAFGKFGFGPVYQVTDVEVGDVDADGDLDVVLARSIEPTLLLHDGAGGFTEALGAFAGPTMNATEIVLADLDGDGDLDAAIGHGGFSDDLFAGDGTGGFTHVGLPTHAASTNGLIAVDVDGDLDLDLVGTTAFDSEGDLLYRNEGGLTFSDASAELVTPARRSRSVTAGDVDADGDADLVFGDDGRNRLLLQDAGGQFHDVSTAWVDGVILLRVTLGDVEGDGFLDAVAVDLPPASDTRIRLLRNPGTGELAADAGALPPNEVSDLSVEAFGDLDGDGDEDLFLFFIVRPARVYRNDGTGVFSWDASDTPSTPVEARDAALGDLDGDGDLDAFVGASADQDYVYRNAGGGVFSLEAANPVAKTLVTRLGDVDVDGDLDVVCGRNLPDPDQWFANDGTATFTLGGTLVTAESVIDALLFDMDGDGDPDLFRSGFSESQLFRNDAGAFLDVTATLPAEANPPRRLAAIDVERDGDVDVLMGPASVTTGSRLLRNDGAGLFTADPAGVGDSPGVAIEFAVGDLDLDGDADLCIASYWELRVLTGVRRQLARRGVPSVGKPLQLELFGPAAEPWFLAYAPQTAQVDLGVFGILFLDPSSIVLVASGLLDGAGADATMLAVPAVPALAGVTAAMQAVVGSQPRLTNLELLGITTL